MWQFAVNAPSRRIAVWQIDASTLLEVFRSMTPDRHMICEGIPEDARIVGVTLEHGLSPHRFNLFLESDAFEQVNEGCVPNPFDPKFRYEQTAATAPED